MNTEAQKNKQPSPSDQKDMSVAQLNQAKTQQIAASIEGSDATSQLDFMSMAMGKATDYGH